MPFLWVVPYDRRNPPILVGGALWNPPKRTAWGLAPRGGPQVVLHSPANVPMRGQEPNGSAWVRPPWSPVVPGTRTKSAQRPRCPVCLAGVGNPGTHGDPQSGQVPKEGSSIGVSGGAWCQNQKCTEASAPGVPGACGHQQHGELAVGGGQLRWSSLPKAVCHRVTRSPMKADRGHPA